MVAIHDISSFEINDPELIESSSFIYGDHSGETIKSTSAKVYVIAAKVGIIEASGDVLVDKDSIVDTISAKGSVFTKAIHSNGNNSFETDKQKIIESTDFIFGNHEGETIKSTAAKVYVIAAKVGKIEALGDVLVDEDSTVDTISTKGGVVEQVQFNPTTNFFEPNVGEIDNAKFVQQLINRRTGAKPLPETLRITNMIVKNFKLIPSIKRVIARNSRVKKIVFTCSQSGKLITDSNSKIKSVVNGKKFLMRVNKSSSALAAIKKMHKHS